MVVVTKSRRPLWLPVSRETYLCAPMLDMRQAIAAIGMPHFGPRTDLRARLGRLEAELVALSPAARASRPWLLGSGSGGGAGARARPTF